jgi:hypothetical protein
MSPVIAILTAGLLAGTMPPAQQNTLVQRYCTVCHTDKSMNGGLSLEHFDAARPDPGDAAMIVSKMKSGAFGAAGIPAPDKATQDALIDALSASAAGASRWTFRQAAHGATGAAMVTASIVLGVPSSANHGEPDLYRLTLTCRAATHEGEMQLAWSPNVPGSGQTISAVVDGGPAIAYKVEGTEKMGNGSSGTSGPGSTVLKALPLPAQTLTISSLFPDQAVVFPFGALPVDMRRQFAGCFGR